MISLLSTPCQVHARDAEVGVPELTLDGDERNAFVCHLDGVSVSESVRRESASHTRCRGGMVQLLGRGRRLPSAVQPLVRGSRTAPRRSGTRGDLEPGVELLPPPTVHSDLAALATLPAADEHRAAGAVQVAL